MALLTRTALLFGLLGTPLAVSMIGCGDGLAPTDWRGEELLRIEGRFAGSIRIRPLPEDLRIGLFWAPKLTDFAPDAGREQHSIGLPEVIPTEYQIQVFDPLAAGLRLSDAVVGIGREAIYADANGNGLRDSDEPILAGRIARGVLFAARELSAEESPTGLSVPAGYHHITFPIGHIKPETRATDDCGVPIGAACTRPDQCGTGSCYRLLGVPLPGGMCVKEITDADPCVPLRSRVVPTVGDAREVSGADALAMLACRTHTDCPRENYTCDHGQGVCRSFIVFSSINSAAPQPFISAQYERRSPYPASRLERTP